MVRKNRKLRSKPEKSETIERVSLRTASPVARLRGRMAVLMNLARKDLDRVTKWSEDSPNDDLRALGLHLSTVSEQLGVIGGLCEELEKSGFLPQRKSYSASTKEGDRVMIRDVKRGQYAEIIKDEEEMADMTVVKKYPGKGGHLVLESRSGIRLGVPTSHIVRLTDTP